MVHKKKTKINQQGKIKTQAAITKQVVALPQNSHLELSLKLSIATV